MNPNQQIGAVVEEPRVAEPRYNGDKISFLPGTSADHHPWTQAISKVIEDYRWEKRWRRAEIEDQKEKAIIATDAEFDELLKPYGQKPSEEQLKENSEGRIGKHKESLKHYHRRIRDEAGWRWSELRDRIEHQVPGLDLLEQSLPEGELAVYQREGFTVYTFLIGKARFGATADTDRGFANNVYTKRGYEDYYYRTSKMFVHDANGVMTRRYVTRAVTVFHLAAMFGLAIIPPASVEDPDDEILPPRLRRTIDNVNALATLNKLPAEEQVPRDTKGVFGGHADVFDITRAAVLYDNQGNVAAHYQDAGQIVRGTETQLAIRNVIYPGRQRDDPMTTNEKASMQVRNGSGANQPFLSTASIQVSDKRIRANKGERFDTGAENQATLEIDLSLALAAKVVVVNQHAEESNAFKIAFDRYLNQDDIKPMERTLYRWIAFRRDDATGNGQQELATLLGQEWSELAHLSVEELALGMAKADPTKVGLTTAALKGLGPEAVAKLMSLQGDKITRAEMTARRLAKDELDEYIYSGRKNREVLMDRIPIGCVTAIRFNVENHKWADVDGHEYPTLAKALQNPGAWFSWSDIEPDLRRYLTYKDGARLIEMHNKAAKEKRLEAGRRV